MTSPTGNRPTPVASDRRAAAGFTLIELILVMAVLVIAFGVTSPTLQRFFQGRAMDSEIRRLLALTRYGQSRAISEGIPIVLWIDTQLGQYGLESAAGYDERDRHALEYKLQDNLQLQIGQPPALIRAGASQETVVNDALATQAAAGVGTTSRARLPAIRLLPDGFIAASSPEYLFLRDVRNEQETDHVWLVQTTNRLAYEISTTRPRTTSR